MGGSRYAMGRVAWGLCQRCGIRFMLRDLVFDGYMPGIRVCVGCYDSRHPQEYPVDVTDPEALWRPAPDDAPWDSVISAIVSNGSIALTWTPPDSSGAARYETYTLSRAFSPDGINYAAAVNLQTFPVTYWGDNLLLSDLVENGNPAEGNNGVESQTLAYTDTVTSAGFYQYTLTALDSSGRGTSSSLIVQVTQLVPLRIIEDNVTLRVLEDGVTFRSLEF